MTPFLAYSSAGLVSSLGLLVYKKHVLQSGVTIKDLLWSRCVYLGMFRRGINGIFELSKPEKPIHWLSSPLALMAFGGCGAYLVWVAGPFLDDELIRAIATMMQPVLLSLGCARFLAPKITDDPGPWRWQMWAGGLVYIIGCLLVLQDLIQDQLFGSLSGGLEGVIGLLAAILSTLSIILPIVYGKALHARATTSGWLRSDHSGRSAKREWLKNPLIWFALLGLMIESVLLALIRVPLLLAIQSWDLQWEDDLAVLLSAVLLSLGWYSEFKSTRLLIIGFTYFMFPVVVIAVSYVGAESHFAGESLFVLGVVSLFLGGGLLIKAALQGERRRGLDGG